MFPLKNQTYIVRKIVAIAIIIHGLYRAATVTSYVDFITDIFSSIINNDSVLVVVATILPFVEFLAGALLFMKVWVKQSATLAAFISLLMAVFTIVGHLHFFRLLYHLMIIGALTYIFIAYRPILLNESNFNLSKRKSNSWIHYFFRVW